MYKIFFPLNTPKDLYLVAQMRAFFYNRYEEVEIDSVCLDMEKNLENKRNKGIDNMLQLLVNIETGQHLLAGFDHTESKADYRKRLIQYFQNIGEYDLYCLSVYDSYFTDYLLIALTIRLKYPNAKILFGGPEIILNQQSQDLLTRLHFIWSAGDIGPGAYNYCRGGAYVSQYEDMKHLSLKNIPMYTDEELEYLDYKIILTGSRGCANKCAFCSSPALSPFRAIPRKVLVEWIETLVYRGVKEIQFNDSTLNKVDFEEFLDLLIEKNIKVSFTRADIEFQGLNGRIIRKMAQAGFKSIAIGLECCSPELAPKIGKKMPNVSTILEITDQLVYAGIQVKYFYIVGMPGQTEPIFNSELHILKTINLRYPQIPFELYDYFVSPGSDMDKDKGRWSIVTNYYSVIHPTLKPYADIITKIPRHYELPVPRDVALERLKKLYQSLSNTVQMK